jgi:CCR4-NOT transcription complex subunit 3
LNLEDEEDYYVIGADDHHKDDDASEKDKEEDIPIKKPAKTMETEPEPSTAKTTAMKSSPTKSKPSVICVHSTIVGDMSDLIFTLFSMLLFLEPSISEPKETKLVTATTKASTTGTSRQTTIPRPADPPTIQYAAAAAANLPVTESFHHSNIAASPSLAAATVTATVDEHTSPAETTEASTSKVDPSVESAVKPAPTAGSATVTTEASTTVATPPIDEIEAHSTVSTPPANSSVVSPAAVTTRSTDISSTQPSRSQSPDEVKKTFTSCQD